MLNRTTLDETDTAICDRRLTEWNAIEGPRVGDWVLMPDATLRRFTHDWGDGLQTTIDRMPGSFYFGNGYMSYSGGLDPIIPRAKIRPVDDVRFGACWFFHHDRQRAGNGVNLSVPCRVFKVEKEK